MTTFDELREKHKRLIYESYSVKKDGFSFKFTIDDHIFTPHWSFDERLSENAEIDKNFLNFLVFNLGMAELVSYWKCACPPIVEVKCGALSDRMCNWWKKLYWGGLGEFFYRNEIKTDFESFMTIVPSDKTEKSYPDNRSYAGCLVPIGGGKDSVVSLELLSGYKDDNLCYIINPRGATLGCAHTAGYGDDKIVGVRRTIDPELLKLNKEGYLNGHTPFSAIVAFSSYIFAYLTGKRYIALSNESSANEGNISGTSVNHQYSKSTEFEADFREYCRSYLHGVPEYFSLLRPWSEWQITAEFSRHPKYFGVFQSCNVGSKTDVWCGKCAKCLYVYIMLSAFLDDSELIKIFGSDMLDNEEFSALFDGLCHENADKPFECVGTRSEIALALSRSYEKRKNGKIPALLARYIAEKPPVPENLDDFYDENNFVPEIFRHKLGGETITEKLKSFFGGKRVLILGLGREGRSTLKILRKCDCIIGIADAKLEFSEELIGCELHGGESYLDCLNDYDIIMKTPGIALFNNVSPEIKGKITSQTDLLLRFSSNYIIGVTGTKGKSTTSSLINHILKKCGKSAVLIGNIGIPPLDKIDELTPDTIIVCEMSCHQLEYVKASPNFAVLLNIYEEHLDHYTDFAAYRAAKENIYLYQNENDTVVFNVECLNDKIKNAKSEKISASLIETADIYIDDSRRTINIMGIEIPLDDVKTQLLGRHNLYNIAIALTAAIESGCDKDEATAAIESFRGLEHRLENAGKHNGVEYINDSISTADATAIAAVNAFAEADTLILGGMDRGISYKELIEFLKASKKVKNLIFLPDSGYRIEDEYISAYGKESIPQNLFRVNNLAEAVEAAATVAKKRVIFSPAAASYGFYKNFEERGRHFKKLVSEL